MLWPGFWAHAPLTVLRRRRQALPDSICPLRAATAPIRCMRFPIRVTGRQVEASTRRLDTPYTPTMEVDANSKKIWVKSRPLGTVSTGIAGRISETVASRGGCFVLVNSEKRVVPVWPKSYGEDIFKFSLAPAGRTFNAQGEVSQAQSSLTSAIQAETNARNAYASAQSRLSASSNLFRRRLPCDVARLHRTALRRNHADGSGAQGRGYYPAGDGGALWLLRCSQGADPARGSGRNGRGLSAVLPAPTPRRRQTIQTTNSRSWPIYSRTG